MTVSDLPAKLPGCCIRLLARPGWFEANLLRSVRLALANPFVRLIQRMAGVPVAATAIGDVIYFRLPEYFDPHTLGGISLIAHELRHVEQCRECGGLVPYAILYTWEYLRKGYGTTISFEAEAYELGDVVYEHLLREFDANPGQPPCVGVAGHRLNPHYRLLVPAPVLNR